MKREKGFSQLTIDEQGEYIRPRIEVKNYRYAWDGKRRKRASYTEYEFWLDDELITTITRKHICKKCLMEDQRLSNTYYPIIDDINDIDINFELE